MASLDHHLSGDVSTESDDLRPASDTEKLEKKKSKESDVDHFTESDAEVMFPVQNTPQKSTSNN